MVGAARTALGEGAGPVRRLIAFAAVMACAQTGMPPGGPPDREPPEVVRITPDTNAVNVRAGSIGIQFNEVVSERPQGAPTLADLFVVSPSTGPASVSWRRTRVEVTPRGGLRPNTTYTVRMLPGLTDLDNNADSAGLVVVFSTGPAIATGRIEGRAFDWVAARPAAKAVVEAIALPDSARYATESDSLGAFAIRNMPPGTFLLRAHVDQNRNRVIDGREIFDTVTVTLADSLRRDMLAAIRDSSGPGMQSAELRDSLTLRLVLDRPLDTLFVPIPARFGIRAADSTDVGISAVLTQADLDRIAADSARTRAVQDSVRQRFLADSIRAADSASAAAAPAPPARPTGRRPGAVTGPPPAAVRDTTPPELPKPAARIPVTTLFLRLSAPLKPATAYRIRADSLRSVTGAVRSSQRVLTTPRPAARDTSRARPDTGRGSRD